MEISKAIDGQVEQFLANSQSLEISGYLLKPVRLQELFSGISKTPVQTGTTAIPETKKEELLTDLKLQVLIVEDNLINKIFTRTLIQRLLPEAAIHEASNGFEAIEVWQPVVPDLVLLDVQMKPFVADDLKKMLKKWLTLTR